jgi:hypothetical protein
MIMSIKNSFETLKAYLYCLEKVQILLFITDVVDLIFVTIILEY